MDRIQNFCSDITIDIAFEADTSGQTSHYEYEATRLKQVGIDDKVDQLKQSIKIAQKSMANHDFKIAKHSLMQIKRDIADIRSAVNSIEPDSKELKAINKICNGVANAVIVITGAFIGGVISGIPKSDRAYADKLASKTREFHDVVKKNLDIELEDTPEYRLAKDQGDELASSLVRDILKTKRHTLINKLGFAAGAGISAGPAIALYKFMDKHIERKAHFIKALDLCEASVDELIIHCDAAQKKVNE